MNVLSLFDGCSCGRAALERAGVHVSNYYASEVDKPAMKVAKNNWPDIIHIGDVRGVIVSALPFIPDLLIGGSPCQGFSMAGNRLNFDDPRSALFFEYVRILKQCREINPDLKFLLENVRMDQRCQAMISELLGVQPRLINSALVSAQNRERLYWFNFGPAYIDLAGMRISLIPDPEDRGIVLKDIIESGAVDREKSYCLDANYFKGSGGGRGLSDEGEKANRIHRLGNCNPSGNGMNGNIFDIEGKSPALTTNKGEGPKIGRMIGIRMTENGAMPFKEGGGGLSEYGTISYETSKAATVTTEHAPKIITGLILAGHAEGINFDNEKRVYDSAGKCPTLLSNGAGGVGRPKSPWTKFTTEN